ncbi:hypothetical protein [Paenibacillus sp. R14(2021)]|uniref:hypothetical protein n=1 Tax=Paenibacillus sp. R14(2021) TaxID=2859228 RepID=UPI001C6157B1|nr:hypothetical protein [Paenibacillus sp. R14(2021)]
MDAIIDSERMRKMMRGRIFSCVDGIPAMKCLTWSTGYDFMNSKVHAYENLQELIFNCWAN